ncbi:MAG: ankyrin repeat domain-containing protein [bacterium]
MNENGVSRTVANSELAILEGIRASRAGDVTKLTTWLKEGNNPNQYDSDGWTPLLWASVRGHTEIVKLLLNNETHPADIGMGHRESEALPVHLAGQSGNLETAEILLNHHPEHLDAVWDLNGHTILLQAVFYGHLKLAEMVLRRGASTSITTARGLGPMELASQFQNYAIEDVIRPYDSSVEEKRAYYETYLKKIAPVIPDDQVSAQKLSDELVSVIEKGIKKAAHEENAVQETLDLVQDLIEIRKAEVNRLGGPLQQPPLIVTVTGNNGLPTIPAVASLRNQLAEYLLEKGADPTLHEKHPMGVQAIIRAAVFNHLDILKMCAKRMTPQRLTDAINEIPLVNGLTAMHDTVLRATMASPDRFEGYLDQARWFVSKGGRSDIEDFAGVTQRNIAENAKDPEVRRRLLEVLDAK